MKPSLDEHIAVIGLASRFPGARDTAEFWGNLCKGQDAVTFPGDAALLAEGVPADLLADPSYVKAYAETPGLELFDAGFFGFTPRDAAVLDPQIRMFLEVAHGSVENAGYDVHRIADGVGVFAATGVNTYLDVHVRSGSGYQMLTSSSMGVSTLSYPDFLATHVAYRFGLRGPALTVSTACSSSAVATHLACQALRTGECDYAIAGGSEAEIPAHRGYQWDPGGPLSADGRCRPFDKDASGTVFSTGAGAVLLKRLGDALADGDHIYAVIRSSAVNNDGATKAGFSAPSVVGQVAAMRQALELAGVEASAVDYVEAHGTGTALGDPIEVAALAEAYRAAAGGAPIALSSVKGNIGHLGHAAGISGLIKVALCLDNQQRVPTANFTEPNPRLRLHETPFRIDAATVAWPRDPERARIAALNSLGFGGTNAHLILEEAPAGAGATAEDPDRPQVLLWSARDPQAVQDYEARLAEYLRSADAEPLADIAATLQDGRTEYPVRGAVIATDTDGCAEALESGRVLRSAAPAAGNDGKGGRADRAPEVVFAFPGQAAQHRRMAVGLYGTSEAFTRALDDLFDRFERASGSAAVREAWTSADDERLADTAIAQPLLFAVEYALAELWKSWGVEPAAVVGHSLGELTAAAVAGVFGLDDAVRLVLARAGAMAAMPTGAMAVVGAPQERLRPLLADGVTVSAVNGPKQTTIGGPADRLRETLDALRGEGLAVREIATSHAFHTESMRPAVELFAAAFEGVTLHEPAVPMVSAATGDEVGTDALDPDFWARQIAEPVRFDLALARLLDQPGTVLLEIGPARTLTGLVRQYGSDAEAVPTLPMPGRAEGDLHSALSAAAALWTAGQRIDWAQTREHRPFRRAALPGYQYQRSRCWIDPTLAHSPADAAEEAPMPVPAQAQAGLPLAVPEPFSVLTWTERPAAELPEQAEDRGVALALLPADEELGLLTVLALQQAGYRPVVARPGTGYQEAEGEFRLRPDDEADMDRLLTELARRGTAPRLLVHALALSDWPRPSLSEADEQLSTTFHSLASLARSGARHGTVAGVLVLAGRSADLTGAEQLDPVKATLHGAVRSLALEAPELACRVIDVVLPAQEEDLAAEIAELLPPLGAPAAAGTDVVVALRGSRRWVREERPFRPGSGSLPVVRRSGVYVLLGGFGGLGLAVARAIAGTGTRPHLVLTGRTLPSADELAAETAALRRLGATVQAESCDIADLRAMRRLFDTVRVRHGAVSGIVHLAGVAGDGMLMGRRREDAEAVLRPKVQGALVLAEVLQDHPPLDFLAYFSSRAALGGLVGSADYAAANCFLDAHAQVLSRSGLPVVSLNWPSWSEVGMAAREERPAGTRHWRSLLDPAADPMLDEHRFSGKPVMPGTGHLDTVVRAFRETVGPAGTPVRLTDVVFQQALVVERPRRFEVVFEPDGSAWQFTVSSCAPDGTDPMRHAVGGIEVLDAEVRPAPEPGLAALREQLTTPMHVDPPTQTKDALFAFGPRWDTIAGVRVGARGHLEKLIELELPEAFRAELPRYALHPTLLDNATAEARTSGHDDAHLPFGYGVFEIYEDIPAVCTSHMARRDGAPGLIVADIDLYGEDGRLVGRIEKYSMRRIEDDGFLAGAPAGPSRQQQEPDGDRPAAEGIDPRTGARMFLSVLSGRHPYQVAVRPFLDGAPVPLPQYATVPAESAPAVVPAPSRAVAAAVAPAAQAAVPEPAAGQAPVAERLAAPVLDRLIELWSRLLGRPVAPDDDFFELGGTSLTAVELMAGIREEFGLRIGIVTMFDHPTVGEFAKVLVDQGAN
ncbi:type I polyketide synthase [Kitasatospora aureofaciens]|uniref:type I polyketide synthase n=1 Tax=Kitasatospora aureofaciens TaxID=1894 RepID=UPI001DA24591|nr:type I polyketide synthase [Kitasatospora aureofaciens]HJD81126.1 SDR family oxidoreductase [Kitasatospora aureofaciens]